MIESCKSVWAGRKGDTEGVGERDWFRFQCEELLKGFGSVDASMRDFSYGISCEKASKALATALEAGGRDGDVDKSLLTVTVSHAACILQTSHMGGVDEIPSRMQSTPYPQHLTKSWNSPSSELHVSKDLEVDRDL
ncbi:hypothetical protein HDU97_008674, partial [Phlyctochytrium planicorne]